ncbi:MAG: hypothetical protein O3C17_21905 [Planctomycetota bacterium]|nr:hypothetical protein [Planctomycetota bacterium]
MPAPPASAIIVEESGAELPESVVESDDEPVGSGVGVPPPQPATRRARQATAPGMQILSPHR